MAQHLKDVGRFALYLDQTGTIVVEDSLTKEVAFKARSFTSEQVEAICAIVEKNITRLGPSLLLQGELRAINRVRQALLLDEMTEV